MTSGIGNLLGKGITIVTKPGALEPVIGLEGTVVTGRTRKAYKRGGVEEARERVIEETSGSLVWLGGVKLFNKIGDKVIAKILDIPKNEKGKRVGSAFDVGQDALRKPFNNFRNNKLLNPKNLSERAISMMKFGKVATSVLAANYIIGFIVPSLNHKITNYFKKQDKEHIVPHHNLSFGHYVDENKSKFDTFKEQVTKNADSTTKGQPAFRGGLNTFTNFIENSNVGQLLSTDAGVLGGRTYNARKKEEKVEIVVRDGGSIYFYMFAQDHISSALNKAESGRWTRLDPNTTNIMHNHLANMFNENNTSMSIDEFKNRVYGTNSSISPKDLNEMFGEKGEVITLERFNEVEKNSQLQARAAKMSTVQPQQMGKSLLTRAQVAGVYSGGELNNPELIKSAHEMYTKGASSDPNKYVSYKGLEKLNGRMKDYVDDICAVAKKNGNKVDLKLLNKMKNKNLVFNGINFVAGFTVAALFLSKWIPEIQYAITRKMTGVDAFPGTYNYQASNQPQNSQKQTQPIKTKVVA